MEIPSWYLVDMENYPQYNPMVNPYIWRVNPYIILGHLRFLTILMALLPKGDAHRAHSAARRDAAQALRWRRVRSTLGRWKPACLGGQLQRDWWTGTYRGWLRNPAPQLMEEIRMFIHVYPIYVGFYPSIYRCSKVSTIQGGAGFLPSTIFQEIHGIFGEKRRGLFAVGFLWKQVWDKLVHITPITMVYGTYGLCTYSSWRFINQHIYIHIYTYIYI